MNKIAVIYLIVAGLMVSSLLLSYRFEDLRLTKCKEKGFETYTRGEIGYKCIGEIGISKEILYCKSDTTESMIKFFTFQNPYDAYNCFWVGVIA